MTVLGGGTVRFTQDGPKTVQISFVLRVDSISEERDETFSLVANVVVGGGSDFGNNPTLTNELRGTIMDNDGMLLYYEEGGETIIMVRKKYRMARNTGGN